MKATMSQDRLGKAEGIKIGQHSPSSWIRNNVVVDNLGGTADLIRLRQIIDDMDRDHREYGDQLRLLDQVETFVFGMLFGLLIATLVAMAGAA